MTAQYPQSEITSNKRSCAVIDRACSWVKVPLILHLVFGTDTNKIRRGEQRIWIHIPQRRRDRFRNSQVTRLHDIEKFPNLPPDAFLLPANAADGKKPLDASILGG